MGRYIRTILCFSLLLTFASSIDARIRKIRYSKRSQVIEQKFDYQVNKAAQSPAFNKETIQFKEWHKKFTPMARKQSGLGNKTSSIQQQTIEYAPAPQKVVRLSISPHSRKHANAQSWNQLREQIAAERFEQAEISSPQGRQFQDIVDEVSLRDVNRFQFMKNKTDDGIPVEKVSDGAAS